MKAFKFLAMLLAFTTMVFSFNSCDNDDNPVSSLARFTIKAHATLESTVVPAQVLKPLEDQMNAKLSDRVFYDTDMGANKQWDDVIKNYNGEMQESINKMYEDENMIYCTLKVQMLKYNDVIREKTWVPQLSK